MSNMNGSFSRSFLGKQSTQQHMDGGMFSTGFSHLLYENYSTIAGFNGEGGRMDRNPFITIIKTIVNGLISPVKAFEMSSNSLHRQKFTNSSMGMTNEMSFPCSEKEVRFNEILELAVGPGSSSQSPILTSRANLPNKKMASEVIAIHTTESFPDLHLSSEKSPRGAETSGKCFSGPETSRKMSCPRQDSQKNSSDDNFVILNRCSVMQGPPCSFIKQRQLSECSEDSFVICFTEDAPEGVIEVISDQSDLECATDEESEEDYDDEDEEEEEDEEDEVDSSTHFPKKTENCFLITGESSQPDSGFGEDIPTMKKVRFNLSPKVHLMRAWDFAYRAARKGHWETFARDRDRFKRRVEGLEHILNPVLDSDHRERIYLTRFCDNTSLDQNEPFDKGTNCAKATN